MVERLSDSVSLFCGDCVAVMAEMEAESVDSVCTDPPYHLTSIVKRFGADNAAPALSNGPTGVYGRASAGFMGKRWDGGDVAFLGGPDERKRESIKASGKTADAGPLFAPREAAE